MTLICLQVPDFEPHTEDELTARACLEVFLKNGPQGTLLDMCFKPRWTRHRKLAEKHGWQTIDGVDVIAYQIYEQWALWSGAAPSELVGEGAWDVLRKEADKSAVLNA